MPTVRLPFLLGLALCLTANAFAETLTFVAQFDPNLGATNNSWFSPANWWIDSAGALVPAGRVPLADETAVITGSVDAGTGGIRVYRLAVTNGAEVLNGSFAIQWLEMRSDSILTDTRVNVLTYLHIAGTNCTLRRTTLNLLAIATGVFSPIPPANAATLTLNSGSVLFDAGWLTLTEGTLIQATGSPQSQLVIQFSAVLEATREAAVRGSAVDQLVIDNSGSIRADEGTLKFEGGIEWKSSGNFGEFLAANTNAEILFASPMQVPVGVTDVFTGPGLNRLAAGATIDGLARIGWFDTNSQGALSANIRIEHSVNGTGTVEVTGSPTASGSLIWVNGTLGVATVVIEDGGTMIVADAPGSTRELSGCTVQNHGTCKMQAPTLSLLPGSVIENSADGVLTAETDCAFLGAPVPAGGEILNQGLFQASTSGAVSFGSTNAPGAPDFSNSGVVQVLSGALRLAGGVSSGQFQTATESSLWFWQGTHVMLNGASFIGSGPVKVWEGVAPARWNVEGNMTASELVISGNGTVVGPGKTSTATLRIDDLRTTANGTLTNANVQSSRLELSDEPLLSSSFVTISKSLFAHGSNIQVSASTVLIAPGATALIAPAAPGQVCSLNLTLGSTLQNYGTVELNDGAVIAETGEVASRLQFEYGSAVSCTNSATIRGSSSHHLVLDTQAAFRTDAGTLSFEGGIDWMSSGATQLDARSPSARILFQGTNYFAWPGFYVITGAGTNQFVSPCSVQGVLQVGLLDQNLQPMLAGNVELAADLEGPGMLLILSGPAQTGGCRWNKGKLSLSAINIEAGGKFFVDNDSSSAHELSGCKINNSGFILWPGKSISAGAGAALNIKTGGRTDITGDGTLSFNGIAPRMTLNNQGIFSKSGGLGTTAITADFTNSGTVELSAGTLALDGTAVQVSGSTFLGTGTVWSVPLFTIAGGTLSGAGLVNAKLLNSGTVAPGQPLGTLSTMPGKDFEQTAAGTLAFELTAAGPGQYDHLSVGANAKLAGTLTLTPINGFVPQPGQSFSVLSSSAIIGKFASLIAPAAPGTVWIQSYTPTNLTLTLATEVKLEPPTVTAGAVDLRFNTTQGVSYLVQASDDVATGLWVTLATVPGDGSSKTFSEPASGPRRFYRILMQ